MIRCSAAGRRRNLTTSAMAASSTRYTAPARRTEAVPMSSLVATQGWQLRRPSVIPGFGLTLGFTLFYLTLIILIPLSGVAWRTTELGWSEFWAIATDERTLKALRISFGTSLIAAMVNVVFGTLLAWVLVR